MAQNNLTVWQRLGKVFGPNSAMDQESPIFKFGIVIPSENT